MNDYAASAETEVFDWHAGIPARDRFCYGMIGTVPVKVVWFTLLDLLLIEEIDGQRMPVRTISRIELSGSYPEKILLDLGIAVLP